MPIHRVNTPAPPVTGQVVRIVLQTNTENQTCQNTFDYMALAPVIFSAAKLKALADAFMTGNLAFLQAVLPTDTDFLPTLAEDVSVGIFPTQQSAIGVGGTGTITGHHYPLETGVTIARQAGIKGQHGMGRYTMPAVPLSFVTPAADPNRLNATGLTAYTTLATSLLGNLSDGAVNYSPVIATRPVPPANVVSRAALILSSTVRTLLGTARRRKPGRGI